MFRVVHNRGHGLSIRCTPCRGCPNVTIRTLAPGCYTGDSRQDRSQSKSKFNGSHPTKLPVMKSGRGSETDSEVCDIVQAGVNNQAQDKSIRNMSTVHNINTRRQQEVNRASCI